MNLIKKLNANKLKQKAKYILYDLLKKPYNKFGVPMAIIKWLPADKSITFIDIGASVGDFAASICKLYKVKKGILIEPIPGRIPFLKSKFNDSKQFAIFNIAVSDKKGEAEFYIEEGYDVLSSLLKMKNEYLDPFHLSLPFQKKTIETETLDNLAVNCKLILIDLIKIDVQGAEHLVLLGGIETLKRTKLIFTEFSYKPLYDKSSTFFDLHAIFCENNFMLVSITPAYTSPNGELLQGDALFVNKALMH